ncbi:MAE_28990/MAE_18760 family HEPN-like nuclease [uncultured Parabacteroides sp.]|uniref:MAE_28990/MAE_18760 family HEPN-like nuclease n=1 Tax=uncultured Parabacteroides sp. TaxID=512312 RepID=UPI0028052514|nr:MAE_28990/MAE_18760 family HEPN-like nuclease [uncultured Parabacteroides sp.]
MILIDEYKQRVKDIKAFYEILWFIDNVETYKNRPIMDTNSSSSLLLTRNMQQCLRAETILVLYNLIESTFSNCILYIYDNIKDEKICYEKLIPALRKVWFRDKIHSKLSLDKARNISQSIADSLTSKMIEFNGLPSDVSGNLDLRKIITISKNLGMTLGNIPDVERTGNILLSIKNKRNELAHGDRSFSAVGALLTYKELLEYRDKTLIFLNFVIDKYQNYVAFKKFRL